LRWPRFQPELVWRPYGHEMITRLEHLGEPWRRKPWPGFPSRLTGRIIMASLYRSGKACGWPRSRRSARTPREANRRAETGSAWLAVSTQHSAIRFAMHRQQSCRVSPGRALSPEAVGRAQSLRTAILGCEQV
jgi:hypothetical protein